MDLKIDENGNAVIKNGYPIYTDHKGDEIEVDVTGLYRTVGELKEEAKGHRLKAKGYKTSLELFDNIEDLEDYKNKADIAIAKVADFKDKDMVAADKVAELRKEWETTAKGATQKLLDSMADKDTLLGKKDGAIRELLVSNAFASSAFFAGKEPKTILPADVAEAKFGNHFKIEEGKNGVPQIIAYTAAGMPISSTRNPGENASFEEAMAEILDQYPGKDRILPAGNSGSGAGGGSGQLPLNKIKALQEQHANALKTGDITTAITLKNQIYAEQNQ